MAKSQEQSDPQQASEAPRSWHSGEEFAVEAQLFLDAAQRFIGRGAEERGWCESQRIRMRLVHVIECADYTESWRKTLHHMLKLCEGGSAAEHRKLAVQTVHTWGGSWKLAQWQTSVEARRACLRHLVGALEAFDSVFSRLKHDLDSLAVKLDAYSMHPRNPREKSAERILAELIVEGADALGFAVEPREPMHAEVLRIERQLERDCAQLPIWPVAGRSSRVLRKAQATSLRDKKATGA